MRAFTQQKSPLSVAARGTSVDWLGEASKGSPCDFDNTQKNCAGQKVCATCAFFRHVRLTVRARRFCALAGERTRPEAPGCEFWPGVPFTEAAL